MSYIEFIKDMQGYRIAEVRTGQTLSKIDYFWKISGNLWHLRKVLENKHPDYYLVDAPGWKGGKLIDQDCE